MPDIKINDNGLFEEERRLNAYLDSNKLEQLENQHAEIDKRWEWTRKEFWRDIDKEMIDEPECQFRLELMLTQSVMKERLSQKNSLVNVALYHIHHIWHYRVRLRESGQPIGRLRKTCKNAFPRTIPVSFGRLDTPIPTNLA
ncbi:hypothetical protein TNCV_1326031 [Trichonephila clavipes]|nr:hypothetical protein TNCV_1326031 [Trichonephila clavipes]